MQALADALDQKLALHPKVHPAAVGCRCRHGVHGRCERRAHHEYSATAAEVVPCRSSVPPTGPSACLAFSCPLQLETRIRAYFGANTTKAHLKMAEAPTGRGEAVGNGWRVHRICHLSLSLLLPVPS